MLLKTLAAALGCLLLVSASFGQEPLPRKSWLGTALAPLTPEQRTALKIKEGGVVIMQVVPRSAGETAGLKVQDVVLSMDGMPAATPLDLIQAVGKVPTGKAFKLSILRDGKPMEITATGTPRPVDKGDNYTTIYDTVVSRGDRLRMIVTKPTAPGKRPVLFLIQGIGYVSQEQPLTGLGSYSRILKAFNDKGYVTVRLDKPGLGDSEGGPADQVDFDEETDGFRAALLKTKSYDFVDPNKILIFGHSMGGCQGPIVASEIPVAGLAVYGTVARTWMEYTLENTRRQAALAGANPAELDQSIRQLLAANHLLFNDELPIEEAKEKYPKWKPGVENFFPDGKTMSGIGHPFWVSCFRQNLADYWLKVDTNVLSIWGESEFIASQVDHPLIAEWVNSKRSGKAKYISIPNSDHGFFKVATMKESFEKWRQPGKEFNPAIIDLLTGWADEILK